MSEEKYYSVSEINRIVSDTIQKNPNLKEIWVKGEISNLSIGPSRHMYFSLKDPNSSIKCTFFLNRQQSYRGKPLKDGMEVLAYGNIQVYEPKGEYSLNVQKIEEVGKGDIYLYIEKLRQELLAQGIFDPEHKKKLPFFPKTLGVATSPNGAAIEDILKIALTNNPNLHIIIAPCIVQGNEAVQSIVEAIQALNNPELGVDVIIAGRGGGSFEDLMPFNEREVVMAFYNSKVPIISAVGHEIDKVLSDFAADAYAPTPTAAAKLAIPDVKKLIESITSNERRILLAFEYYLKSRREKILNITNRRMLTDPSHYIENLYLKLDEVTGRIILHGKGIINKKREQFVLSNQLQNKIDKYLERVRNHLKLVEERVEHFSPLGTLLRGYSIVRNQSKKIIHSVKQVEIGEKLEILLHEGKFIANVLEKEESYGSNKKLKI